MDRLVAVVGPTAVGKSALALRLARDYMGEILSADSRQVYRYLDIGTAKLCTQERLTIPHHLIDIVNPKETFSLAQYQEMAFRAISQIKDRGNLPILVGGSGLYVWAMLENWDIPRVAPDAGFRRKLEERVAHGESPELYKELSDIAPIAASRIDSRNIRRVIRALEVYKAGGGNTMKRTALFESLIIGLTTERSELYRRIDNRVDDMIEEGLIEEVKGLIKNGYGLNLPAMSGIGYRQIGLYVNEEKSLDESIQLIKTESHRLVRQQYNWFKLKDDRIKWFDIRSEPYHDISCLVDEFIRKK
jgi:tRNA dimethylallyltransferase